MSVLLSLILFAGLSTIALSRASAQARVLSLLVEEHVNALAGQSARADFLPNIAEAMLSSMEGRRTEVDLEGRPISRIWDGHEFTLEIWPDERRGWWAIAWSGD